MVIKSRAGCAALLAQVERPPVLYWRRGRFPDGPVGRLVRSRRLTTGFSAHLQDVRKG